MSQTKIQGTFLTDDTVTGAKLADTLTVSSNTTFANTAGTYTLPVINFSSANVQGVATNGKAIAMALVFG
jgi:hypothetical protein